MKTLKWSVRIASIAVVCLVAITALRAIPPASIEGHRTSLRAKLTMLDGTQRSVALQGVGCNESICSRIVVGCVRSEGLWLDSLASVRNISPDANGTINAVFDFKDGGETTASVLQNNRVLYVSGLWHSEKLDLGRLTRIEFLN
jgi:hypothetical protein